jgi:Rrf2 family protein
MRITLESDYALRIVTALAENDARVDAKTLSEQTSVTPRFTLKILHKLAVGNIVRSYKGVGGGYVLAISPSKLTLKTVIELIDGPIAIARCIESEGDCALNHDKAACTYHHIFDSLSLDLAQKLNKITIQDVIDKTYKIF